MLTLDANGGTINSSASETMNACGPFMSGSVIYPAAYGVPVRDGYRFTGWYSDAGCSGKPVTFLSAVLYRRRLSFHQIGFLPSGRRPGFLGSFA